MMSFLAPVGKALPPSIVADTKELTLINSWELSSDKVGRYLAAPVFTVFGSVLGFDAAVAAFLAVTLLTVLLKSSLHVKSAEKKSSRQRPGFIQQVTDGAKTLIKERELRPLILNSVLTNCFTYPMQTILYPVLFKKLGDVESPRLQALQDTFGIAKDKAWMNYAALVSFGGIWGPFLSTFSLQLAPAHTSRSQWGLQLGLLGQTVTGIHAVLVLALAHYGVLGAEGTVLHLFVGWAACVACNSTFTSTLSALSQKNLAENERGRFIANLLAVFNVANFVGSTLLGWCLALSFEVTLAVLVVGSAGRALLTYSVLQSQGKEKGDKSQ
jgi:Na+/melibiose symporter-like transporter